MVEKKKKSSSMPHILTAGPNSSLYNDGIHTFLMKNTFLQQHDMYGGKQEQILFKATHSNGGASFFFV